jgi:pimeloyl-ACP methyl ester carboxylesterase
MFKFFIAAFLLLFFNQLFAQSNSQQLLDTAYNLNFETIKAGDSLPVKWHKFNNIKGYKCVADTLVKHGGNQSLLIEQTDVNNASSFASIVNVIPGRYIGKEIEFRAYLKFQGVDNFAGILIRIDDANHKTLQFNSLQPQGISGTRDWQLYSIKTPLPPTAQWIFVAAILGGPGKLWVDDGQVLVDDKDVSWAPVKPNYILYPPEKPVYGSNKAASGRVKLKDANLYYETYGAGEPLLLLHGNSQSIYAFNYQIGELSKKYKVIVVDTRGQGKSTDETTGVLSYDLFANDMKQLLDSLHIKKTNILGWSDGGNTGLIMAVKYPQYVNKLAIMGANLFPTTEAVPDSVLQQVKQGIDEFQEETDAHSKMEVRLFTMLLNEPHLTFDELKTIKAPVLVMAGQHDIILEKHTRAIAAAIPKSELVIFKGGTHDAPAEIADKFNETVLKFMSEP